MNKSNDAIKCFNSGYNCAQAIFSTYCEQFGVTKEDAIKIAGGFGSGMGRLQEVCGAVTGAFMVLSLKYPNDRERLYSKIQKFEKKFRVNNKTISCRELLGINLIGGDKEEISVRVNDICPKVIISAAEILEKMI